MTRVYRVDRKRVDACWSQTYLRVSYDSTRRGKSPARVSLPEGKIGVTRRGNSHKTPASQAITFRREVSCHTHPFLRVNESGRGEGSLPLASPYLRVSYDSTRRPRSGVESYLPEGKVGLVLPAGKTRKEIAEGGCRHLDSAVVCTTVFCRQFGASPQNRQLDASLRAVCPRTQLLPSHSLWQAQKCTQTLFWMRCLSASTHR
jgi:hypothetical protein